MTGFFHLAKLFNCPVQQCQRFFLKSQTNQLHFEVKPGNKFYQGWNSQDAKENTNLVSRAEKKKGSVTIAVKVSSWRKVSKFSTFKLQF